MTLPSSSSYLKSWLWTKSRRVWRTINWRQNSTLGSIIIFELGYYVYWDLGWSWKCATETSLERTCCKKHSWLTVSSCCMFGPASVHTEASSVSVPPYPTPYHAPLCSWTSEHGEGSIINPHLPEAGLLWHVCFAQGLALGLAETFPGCAAVIGTSYLVSPPFSLFLHKCQVWVALCRLITPNPAPSPLYLLWAFPPINHLQPNPFCLGEHLRTQAI